MGGVPILVEGRVNVVDLNPLVVHPIVLLFYC